VSDSPTLMLSDLEQLTELQRRQRELLVHLLDEKVRDPGFVFVQRASMGGIPSFHGTRSMRWINDNVQLFSELPLFNRKIDEKGNFIVDEESIALLEQRAPDWTRQLPMVRYLIEHPDRKFPTILVVVSARWVDDASAGAWGPDGTATQDSFSVTYLDTSNTVGMLDLFDVTIYVIDGQHRLIAIKGLAEIEKQCSLTQKSAMGHPQFDKRLSEQELQEVFGVEGINTSTILNESMGIEFIPAVMQGETREQARVRIRSIFQHINLTARPLSLGEAYTMSESDGFAIVGRQIGLSHPLFRKERPGDRVNWKTSGLPAKSIWLTTSTTLRDVAFSYLGHQSAYSNWVRKRKEVAKRPTDDELAAAESTMVAFWDLLAELPVFSDIQAGGSIDDWRQFKSEKVPLGRGHLLLRPLGQLILAEALGLITSDTAPQPTPSVEELFEKLAAFDSAGGFEGVHTWESMWHGITFNPTRQIMNLQGRSTAVLLLRHLLTGLGPSDERQLEKDFRLLRTQRISDDEMLFINYDGKQVDSDEEIQLPPSI
jgi:hypothetical protein